MELKKFLQYIRNRFINKRKSVSLNPFHREQFELLYSQSLKSTPRFQLEKKDIQLYPHDATQSTPFDRHYVYHPAWAVRVVKIINPVFHVDISSTLHFCSMLSAFIPVKFFDFRPAAISLSDLHSEKADLTALNFESNSIESLSCMHTVEHIGLGRYGDSIDYDGDLKAIKELSRVLAIDGHLLFVVPVGEQSIIHFNGHRVYNPDLIKAMFHTEGLTLKEFVLIPEQESDGGLVIDPSSDLIAKQSYACGCFWYTKS